MVAGPNKDALSFMRGFNSIEYILSKMSIFHTDRGNEFKNNAIDGLLDIVAIKLSFQLIIGSNHRCAI